MDEKILAVTSRDIVAAEAHYHHSCYKNYTRMKISHEPEDDKEDGDEDEMAEKVAHTNLFEYIRSDIIPNKKIVTVTSLAAKLKSFIPSGRMNKSTRKNFRRRLESELGNSVHIFQDDRGWLIMVPDNITVQDVVVENQLISAKTLANKINDLRYHLVLC